MSFGSNTSLRFHICFSFLNLLWFVTSFFKVIWQMNPITMYFRSISSYHVFERKLGFPCKLSINNQHFKVGPIFHFIRTFNLLLRFLCFQAVQAFNLIFHVFFTSRGRRRRRRRRRKNSLSSPGPSPIPPRKKYTWVGTPHSDIYIYIYIYINAIF